MKLLPPGLPRLAPAKIAVSIGLAAAALFSLGVYVYWHGTAWATVRLESPRSLLICAVGMLGAWAIVGEIFRITTTQVGRTVGYWESTALAVVGVAIDTMFPLHGGAAFRGFYLRQRHGLHLAAFVATILGYNVLRLFAAAILAFAASLWLATGQSDRSRGLEVCLWVAGACIAGAVTACSVSPAAARGILPASVLGVINAFHEGWAAILGSRGFLFRMFLLTVAQLVCEMIAVWGAWAAVGVELGPPSTALVTCFAILAGLAGLTPNGLGMTELVTVAVGSAVAVEPAHGIAASLLARGVNLSLIAMATPIAIAILGLGRWALDNEPPTPSQTS